MPCEIEPGYTPLKEIKRDLHDHKRHLRKQMLAIDGTGLPFFGVG